MAVVSSKPEALVASPAEEEDLLEASTMVEEIITEGALLLTMLAFGLAPVLGSMREEALATSVVAGHAISIKAEGATTMEEEVFIKVIAPGEEAGTFVGRQ